MRSPSLLSFFPFPSFLPYKVSPSPFSFPPSVSSFSSLQCSFYPSPFTPLSFHTKLPLPSSIFPSPLLYFIIVSGFSSSISIFTSSSFALSLPLSSLLCSSLLFPSFLLFLPFSYLFFPLLFSFLFSLCFSTSLFISLCLPIYLSPHLFLYHRSLHIPFPLLPRSGSLVFALPVNSCSLHLLPGRFHKSSITHYYSTPYPLVSLEGL